MEFVDSLPWIALLALGAVHGVNPAMGWLFAVSLGLQEQDRRAVWRALGPLALGHALAIATAVGAAAVFGLLVPLSILKWIVALLLLGFAVRHLVRHRHPRGTGMRVGGRELTTWSFLMGSAHGAGLMVLPFILGTGTGVGAAARGTTGHTGHGAASLAGVPAEHLVGISATLIHTAAYLLVTTLIAVLVYEKLGLRFLRSAWINLDLLWAIALLITAAVTPFL